MFTFFCLVPPEPSPIPRKLYNPFVNPVELDDPSIPNRPSILHEGNVERRKSSPHHKEKGRVSFSIGGNERDDQGRRGSSQKKVLFYVASSNPESESAPCLFDRNDFPVNPLFSNRVSSGFSSSSSFVSQILSPLYPFNLFCVTHALFWKI